MPVSDDWGKQANVMQRRLANGAELLALGVRQVKGDRTRSGRVRRDMPRVNRQVTRFLMSWPKMARCACSYVAKLKPMSRRDEEQALHQADRRAMEPGTTVAQMLRDQDLTSDAIIRRAGAHMRAVVHAEADSEADGEGGDDSDGGGDGVRW